MRALVCVVAGHRWATAEENTGPDPLMRCRRCGRRGIFSEQTRRKLTLEQRIQPTDRFGNRLP